MNRIKINHDTLELEDIELSHGELSIGRANDNDLHFDDPYLSGHHAKIITLFNASHVEDLNSTNGTFVNGKQITKHTLHDGDIIVFGDYRIIFSSDTRHSRSSDHQETMILDSDDLMKRLKTSGVAEQAKHSVAAVNASSTPAQQQGKPRPVATHDELEFLRKMEKKLQPKTLDSENSHVPGNTAYPKPAPVEKKLQQNKDNAAKTNTQRPVLHTSREQLFMRKEEKKRLLSPVTVYILTVALICIVALLLLPYIPV